MTLDDALKKNGGTGPGFHMMRHLLSFLIVAHHCRVVVFASHQDSAEMKGHLLTGDRLAHMTIAQGIVELLRPGIFALVGTFFALSGFLVIGSAFRNSNVKVFFCKQGAADCASSGRRGHTFCPHSWPPRNHS